MPSIPARAEPETIPLVREAGRGVLPPRVRRRAARLARTRLELRDEARRASGDAAGTHVSRGLRVQPAAHVQHRSGDVTRLFRGQERDGIGNVVGRTEAAEGDTPYEGLAGVV